MQSLVESGHGCGARVVAEGIEPPPRPLPLRALVDYGQGWHYGRPGPPEALAAAGPQSSIPAPRREQRALQSS